MRNGGLQIRRVFCIYYSFKVTQQVKQEVSAVTQKEKTKTYHTAHMSLAHLPTASVFIRYVMWAHHMPAVQEIQFCEFMGRSNLAQGQTSYLAQE